MDFATRLTAARKAQGITRRVLADTIAIHVTQVRRYEAATSQPTLDVLKRIAVALHVSTDALVFDPDQRGLATSCAWPSRPPTTSTLMSER